MTPFTDWSRVGVLEIPRNSNGTAHVGHRDMESGWICNSSCPACDEDAGNICRLCNAPATWGHTPECPLHRTTWEKSSIPLVKNCSLLGHYGQWCTNCPHDGDCNRQSREIELIYLEDVLEKAAQG